MREAPWRLKGGRTVINRFLEARRKAKREIAVWHRRAFCYTYACLELDMFKGGKFTKVCANKLDDSDGAAATSSSKHTFRFEKNIRSACQNVMVLTALVYQDAGILARQKIFVSASGPLDQWHHDQSVACRSVGGTRKFLVSQLADRNFLNTVHQVLAQLESHAALKYVGFTIPQEVLFLGNKNNM